MSSFSIPLSGLTAASEQLQSVSNNLANLNTDGYKDQDVRFSDVYSQVTRTNGAGDPIQTGSGVQTAATFSNFTEGNLNATGTASNMAISGNGFFVVQSSDGTDRYTRAGDFTPNSAGQLTTPSGDLVLGYPAVNGVVNTASALQPIQVSSVTSPAVATGSFHITANLSADTATGDTAPPSTLPIYDSLGDQHTLTVSYTKTGTNQWSYSATIPSADTAAGGTGNTVVGSGTLTFDSSGQLTSPAGTVTLTIPAYADGAAAQTVTWDLTDTAGNTTLTQTASPSATSSTTQDGYASGTLTSYAVQPDGTIQGNFSSGKTLVLGQVAVASFANVQGLAHVGNTELEPTAASGAAVIGVAGTGGRGTVAGGSVEQSNVDIAAEFAKLIVAQQAYSANAKSITTFNQVSQTTINMIQ